MGTSAARRRPARARSRRTVEPREILGMTLLALGAFLGLMLLGGVNGGSAGTPGKSSARSTKTSPSRSCTAGPGARVARGGADPSPADGMLVHLPAASNSQPW